MATAAGQVLNVAELLERILLSLLMKDILLDQRVNTYWKGLIKSSPKIQQALFYRPDYNVETWKALSTAWIDCLDSWSESMPTIVDAVTPEVMVTNCGTWAPASSVIVLGRPNPLLLGYREEGEEEFGRTAVPIYRFPNTDSCTILISRKEFEEWYNIPVEAPAKAYSGTPKDFRPSWCDMFLTQPPTKRLRYEIVPWTDLRGEYGLDGDDLKSNEGLTCGTVIEELLRQCGSANISTDRAQHIEINQPSITALPYLTATGGFDDFRRLQGLCGSKQALLELVGRIGAFNTASILKRDNFERLTRYGLMEQLVDSTNYVENLLFEYEHRPDCRVWDCTGCRPGFAKGGGDSNNSEDRLLE